ncbi:uncharacterized protein LOC121991213 [Zingiber officinale]|uniref:uncharacterized protein LOC121991213 n=1 Tax=Zingiber officinale TaxID=94328 RepID=UPI001C4A8811|nr:uncharacterized protein LOC121991213 [Zingiber officinale]
MGQKLKKWCEGYDIQQAFTSVAYPQSNGHAEVTNRKILRILLVRLDRIGGSWVDELPSMLWVIRTAPKEGTRAMPFHLHYNEDNAERRFLELDLVDEARAKVVVRLMVYRQTMKQSYNRMVIPRSFQVGDLAWKKVKSVGDVTKLETPWARPFKVVEKFLSGAYYLEDEDKR